MRFTPAVRLAAALLLVWLAPGGRGAASAAAADVRLGATLTILSQPVQVDVGDLGSFGDAVDGQLIQVGDVVRTGPDGLALLTFFDGSESQLGAGSQVRLTRAEFNPDSDPDLAPHIAVSQTAGVTVNHVVPMPPGGSFETNTPAATGLVRGTSFVVTVGSAQADADVDTDPDEQVEAGQASPPDCAALEPGADPRCLTSVVLLADPDGHVGRVDVAALSPSVPVVELQAAGEVGTASATAATRLQVEQPIVDALTTAAHNHTDASAARNAQQRAREVLQSVAPAVTAPPLTPPADLASVVSSAPDPGSASSTAGPSGADASSAGGDSNAGGGNASPPAPPADAGPNRGPQPAGPTDKAPAGRAANSPNGSAGAGNGQSNATTNPGAANANSAGPSASTANGSGPSSGSGQPGQAANSGAGSSSSGSASPPVSPSPASSAPPAGGATSLPAASPAAPAANAPASAPLAASNQQPAKPQKAAASGSDADD
jgi:FecR protein